jgi:hypothetical protein
MKTIKKAAQAVAEAMPNRETLEGAAKETVKGGAKAVFGKGTVENIENLTQDKKQGVKGLAKAATILTVMILVGIVAAPFVGPLMAAVFAIGAGVATPKIASSLGIKGLEQTKDERSKSRIDQLKPEKLMAKKVELEKSASEKKKIGIAAVSIGVLVTFLTGGIGLPVLLACAIGAAAVYSSSKDSKKANALNGITDESTPEEIQQAALSAGIIKEKDLEKILETQQNRGNSHSRTTNIPSNVGAEAVDTLNAAIGAKLTQDEIDLSANKGKDQQTETPTPG